MAGHLIFFVPQRFSESKKIKNLKSHDLYCITPDFNAIRTPMG
ncbi:hypothetical protein X474_09440 [Dethiosulfatarculus sandiegensis]|uniref:Uncharacterized protein n=1 Tax=Dethiosulfatarculus sandiegensis TaxID=1429043 RepID=A0A0D2JFA6_9BACT|nr:hypothetical protein X474_09440 [Dethiosulfatarculus sandiegensis]